MDPNNPVPTCEQCLALHQRQNQKVPCHTPRGCEKPFLDSANATAWEIYSRLQHQPRVAGMGSYIGIDFNLFGMVCDAYEVDGWERRMILDKIIILNKVSVSFAQQEEKARNDAERSKAQSKR